MPKVNCTVDACNFWQDDNICGATEITVAALAAMMGDGRDMEVGTVGESKTVTTSAETQCVTFQPRPQSRRRR